MTHLSMGSDPAGSDPKEPLLLTPGPTIVPPAIRQALAAPMIHHRTPEFQKILKEAADGLKKVFGTSQEVFILTSSGTGAMEAAVANLISSGDEVLVIRGGKFGERWGELCGVFNAQVISFDVPWGKPLDFKRLSQVVAQSPSIKAVFSTLCETSTGVVFDIRGIRQAIGQTPLLVVDAISGLGADSFEMDAWGVDVTVCGSQKGLMLPPGLAFIALSERSWKEVESSKSPRYYYDLRLAKKAWGQTDTPFTPAISLIVGLHQSLKQILSIGVSQLVENHRKNAAFIRKQVTAMGLTLYTDPSCTSNAVTSINMPSGINGKELLKTARSRYNIFIAGGQGKELDGKVIRIAAMGAVTQAEIRKGLTALEEILKEMGYKIPVQIHG